MYEPKRRDIICLDTCVVIWGIKKESNPEDEDKQRRAHHLLVKLDELDAKVIVPSVALGETLSGCDDSRLFLSECVRGRRRAGRRGSARLQHDDLFRRAGDDAILAMASPAFARPRLPVRPLLRTRHLVAFRHRFRARRSRCLAAVASGPLR